MPLNAQFERSRSGLQFLREDVKARQPQQTCVNKLGNQPQSNLRMPAECSSLHVVREDSKSHARLASTLNLNLQKVAIENPEEVEFIVAADGKKEKDAKCIGLPLSQGFHSDRNDRYRKSPQLMVQDPVEMLSQLSLRPKSELSDKGGQTSDNLADRKAKAVPRHSRISQLAPP